MKKLLLLLSLLLVPVLVLADGEGNTIMLKFAGVPTGNCSFIMMGLNTTNGDLYDCPAGAWVKTGTGGGGGGLPPHLSYADPTLTVSAATFGNGTVALSGNTSGTATFTAPAVAGTTTNPVAASNVMTFPAGTNAAPMIELSGFPNYGYGVGASGFNFFSTAGTYTLANTQNATTIAQGSVYGWAPTNDASGVADTGLSRLLANNVLVGNGVQGNESGLLRSGNACRVTADITLPVNTTTNVCGWNLPAVAKPWAWQCDLIWAITAGTGTNTISIGVNASQTPTGTTNAAAVIYSAASTFVTGPAVAISASGAINVLTSGTITPGAGAWTSHTSGTLLASATAGTLNISMTAAGTTATAAAKAGSTCTIY